MMHRRADAGAGYRERLAVSHMLVSFLFILLCRVKFVCFVLSAFDVHQLKCVVLLWPVNDEIVL